MKFLNEQMGVLMEEKKGHATAFDHLNVTGYLKGFFDQRDELYQQVQAKIAEVICSEFEKSSKW